MYSLSDRYLCNLGKKKKRLCCVCVSLANTLTHRPQYRNAVTDGELTFWIIYDIQGLISYWVKIMSIDCRKLCFTYDIISPGSLYQLN